MISIRHLCKTYPGATPLRDFSAEVEKGDVIAVIGPSGTGKSTLLQCLNLLERPSGGEIVFEGECVTAPGYDAVKLRRRVGMVFQSFHLFGHLTVAENCMLAPMELKHMSRRDARALAMRLLAEVGMAERADRMPDALSGGQKQRAAIARTLAMEPDIILFDEPTSALDPASVGEVQDTIRGLAKKGTTMMIVTHDMAFAESIATRVFFMDEGVLYEEGAPERIFHAPQRENTRRFVRSGSFCTLHITGPHPDIDALCEKLFAFARANRVNTRTAYRLLAVLEELVVETLLPALGEEPDIICTAEASEDGERVTVTTDYAGSPIDMRAVNPLALSVIEGMAGSAETVAQDNGGRCVIRLDIRA